MQENDSDESILKEDLLTLKELYNQFTEHSRTGEIRDAVNSDILSTILDLIIDTINEYQQSTSKTPELVHNKVLQLHKLVGIHNEYIRNQR